MNENDMVKIFFRCRLPAYSIQPRMHTDKPNAVCAATAGLDCGGKRSATPLSEQTVAQKAVSPLRSATAVQILSVFIRGYKLYRNEI
jgi:hypothetical protein